MLYDDTITVGAGKLYLWWITLIQWLLLVLLSKQYYNFYAGAGIHVFIGVSTGDLQVPGSLPNNGIVISLTTPDVIGHFFRFYCRSDSMMNNVGMLIGPDGTTVASGDVIQVEHSGHRQLHVYANNIPTASDRGVYTCHIPLQSGENRSINVGIYPSGFSSKCLLLYIESSANPLLFTRL